MGMDAAAEDIGALLAPREHTFTVSLLNHTGAIRSYIHVFEAGCETLFLVVEVRVFDHDTYQFSTVRYINRKVADGGSLL